jgi:hypothetical protein
MGAEKPEPDALAQSTFVITMIGTVLFVGVVVLFIL